MREKLETLPLAQLRELAKASGIKGATTLKKAELIDALVAENERREEESRAEEKLVAKAEVKPEAQEETKTAARKVVRATANKESVATSDREKTRRTAVIYKGDKPSQTDPGVDAIRSVGTREDGAGEGEKMTSDIEGAVAEPKAQDTFQEKLGAEAGVGAPGAGGTSGTASGTASQSTPRRPVGIDEVYTPQEGDKECCGIIEVMAEGFGFIRSDNYLPGENDIYVSPAQIRHFQLKTGDILKGYRKARGEKEKFSPLVFLETINGYPTKLAMRRPSFENLTPIFPNERMVLERPGCSIAMRAMDLLSPVGKGQRGMIVSPPKAGKTTLLKEVAHSILKNNPRSHMLILLIDERPEEVTDIKEAIIGEQVEVIYSTFDETPEHHMRVSEMTIERARRLVEHGEDVVILLDSITRLTRAYNQVIPPSGRTLSGGLDPAALHMPKRFFGAARNMREGGSLTILATALVETGSKMDDVVYEEFKGTGNMEIVLDRKLSEKRIFPAIDLAKSGTRREDLLLSEEELEAIGIMRKALNGLKPDEATDRILDMFSKTKNNAEFVQVVKKNRMI